MKSKVYELNNLLSELGGQGGYFIDFISTRGIQAGIIGLHPGENDTQEPHSVDEIYYVIEGNGFIKLNGKGAQKGSMPTTTRDELWKWNDWFVYLTGGSSLD